MSHRLTLAHLPKRIVCSTVIAVPRSRCLHVTSKDGNATLRDAIAQDHSELKHYYDQYKAATTKDARTKFGNAFVWEITRHAFGEELIVFPAMEQYLREEGQAWVAEDRKDTQHFKESTHAFDTMSLNNPHREKLLDILWADFIAHARKEEDVQLSKLDSVLGNEKSSRLARMFEKTKRLTATRPHPGSPNELPWATASAFMAAPIDKVRDMFRLFPDEEEVK